MNAITADLICYIGSSPTPFHAVHSAVTRLAAVGFSPLDEGSPWQDLKPGRYFLTRGDSALIAFVLPPGDADQRAAHGFRVIGAHPDSPNLRLKPHLAYVKEGYWQLAVEVYGGVLLNSWLDLDLQLAGRVVIRQDGRLVSRLVSLERPLARVPQLAIHLDRDVNEKGLNLNRQEHLAPVLGLASGGHDARALIHGLCATALGVSIDDVVTTELMLHDRAAPSTGGLDDAFLYSARLDNQAMCHAAITALAAIADAALADVGPTPLIALFDHEEVGSDSAYGAASPLLQTTLERIMMSGARDALARALARSFCVSADMAHAVHPNYPDRHEARHRPVLNGGPVIKVNSQQRYATCARTAALFQELCRAEDVPVQHYAHRTDLPCGSTIGPITATRLGIRTVDVGNPMLSMHSAREMAGTKDPELMVRVLRRFLQTADPFVGAAVS